MTGHARNGRGDGEAKSESARRKARGRNSARDTETESLITTILVLWVYLCTNPKDLRIVVHGEVVEYSMNPSIGSLLILYYFAVHHDPGVRWAASYLIRSCPNDLRIVVQGEVVEYK